MAELNLKEFVSLPISDISIIILKYNSSIFVKTTYEISLEILSTNYNYITSKRYTEFQGFYDSLTLRYKNLKFPAFPSKFQMLNKQDFRKEYFEGLFQSVLQLAQQHSEIKKELLKLLYEFIFSGEKGTALIKDIKERKNSIDSYSTAPNLKVNLDYFDSKSTNTSSSLIHKTEDKVIK